MELSKNNIEENSRVNDDRNIFIAIVSLALIIQRIIECRNALIVKILR